MTPRYYYSVCQAGAEKAVKEEVLGAHPGLHFAFSRPGFITFKEADATKPLIADPESVFTRLWGVSIAQSRKQSAGESWIASLLGQVPEGSLIQAFERDLYVPGDEPDDFTPRARIHELLRNEGIRLQDRAPVAGEWVYDLIWIDEGHVFLGRHQHWETLDPAPGNAPVIPLPQDSPSRAYLKLEEAIHRFQPKLHPGLEVLEVGCSPGGASLAMVNRGFKVTGIDPKRMAPILDGRSGFRWIPKTARTVRKEDLGSLNPEWLVLDMNLAPLEALDEIQHLLALLREIHGPRLALREGFLTLKLNDWGFTRHIPLYLKRLLELGFLGLRATQLCSNRQEFFVHASGFHGKPESWKLKS